MNHVVYHFIIKVSMTYSRVHLKYTSHLHEKECGKSRILCLDSNQLNDNYETERRSKLLINQVKILFLIDINLPDKTHHHHQ
jgi:hypothetical protein